MLIYLSLDNTSQTNAKMDQKGLALPLVFLAIDFTVFALF